MNLPHCKSGQLAEAVRMQTARVRCRSAWAYWNPGALPCARPGQDHGRQVSTTDFVNGRFFFTQSPDELGCAGPWLRLSNPV